VLSAWCMQVSEVNPVGRCFGETSAGPYFQWSYNFNDAVLWSHRVAFPHFSQALGDDTSQIVDADIEYAIAYDLRHYVYSQG
jgi:hypothetical protein